jgi:hypothetical protein
MNSRERILAAWNGRHHDQVPLTAWCFGIQPPSQLRWLRHGKEIKHWYSLRMEHIHTLPEPWELEDDFARVLAWQSLGVDDILDVSVPWAVDPQVTWEDSKTPLHKDQPLPVLVREYHTPSGSLRHAVRQTDEKHGPGWVVQPGYVPIFEDLNLPRAVKHAVSSPAEVPVIKHLYCPPDAQAKEWFAKRMQAVKDFADRNQVPVQAWSAFGMDGVVWLTGPQGAVLMAMDSPQAFGQLVDIVAETDYGRTELAASAPGVDMVIQRGWYSSTDFWSPKLFDLYVYPHLAELASLAHRQGKKLGYVMTTGVAKLGPRLADAGVDVLYYVDPIQDHISLEDARDQLATRMTLVGGTNALSLVSSDRARIRDEVRHAIQVLGPTNRFILAPVDALFPDTPWDGVSTLIDAWRSTRGRW